MAAGYDVVSACRVCVYYNPTILLRFLSDKWFTLPLLVVYGLRNICA